MSYLVEVRISYRNSLVVEIRIRKNKIKKRNKWKNEKKRIKDKKEQKGEFWNFAKSFVTKILTLS